MSTMISYAAMALVPIALILVAITSVGAQRLLTRLPSLQSKTSQKRQR